MGTPGERAANRDRGGHDSSTLAGGLARQARTRRASSAPQNF
jgi:hypothetical protein